jgi:NADH-ubiquinone oxidoreductase chain 5
MLVLITSSNFLQLFLGWEGVGLCSYLLISFWSDRIQANKAAIKAMVMNRIADVGLALGLILIFDTFHSLDYSVVFNLVPFYSCEKIYFIGTEYSTLHVICFLLFIGAMGKSAQIGLHTWLPDAMEGPTPVSALIHAATMVTAGVFLVIRCSPLFEYAPAVLCFMAIVGAVTALFGALTAVAQFDIKKIIAYSTCSQLGYMVFCCGLSEYSGSLYHLTNHAFFKALLFLGSGAIIHAMSNEQDLRKMGGLIYILPFTYITMLIGSLALIGFPFTSGFYSKDIILEVAHEVYILPWSWLLILGLATVFCTAYYSTRILYVTFLTSPNGYKSVITEAHEAPFAMALPLFLLSLGSIFSGYFLENIFIGVGSEFFKNSIFVLPIDFKLVEAEILSTTTQERDYVMKLHPLQFTLLGCFVGLYKYSPLAFYNVISNYFPVISTWWNKITRLTTGFMLVGQRRQTGGVFLMAPSIFYHKIFIFLNQKWFFDKVYNQIIGTFILKEAYQTGLKSLDKGLFEIWGPYGIITWCYNVSLRIKLAHSGYIWHYISTIIISMLVVIGFIEFIV